MIKLIATPAAIAVLLLAFGCGAGGEDEATAQVSKAQFIKQAKTICTNSQKEIRAVIFEKKKPASSSVDRYKQLAPVLKREAEELDAISGPKGVEAKIEPLIERIMQVSELVAEEGEKALNDPLVGEYKSEAFDLQLRNC